MTKQCYCCKQSSIKTINQKHRNNEAQCIPAKKKRSIFNSLMNQNIIKSFIKERNSYNYLYDNRETKQIH